MKKKLVSLLSLGVLVGSVTSLASCNKESAVDIAMISDIGTINDSGFNQYTWEGAKKAAQELGRPSAYFVPSKDSDDERKAGIDAMLRRGAKAIVLTGYKFNKLVNDYAARYPKVAWFLIDGSQNTANDLKNVYSVEFKEQEAGYLAGYAVVKDKKYTKLAFMGGMAVPAVERFGFGYLSGICDAANELKAKNELSNNIEVTYGYTGDFTPSESNQSNATSWYNSGTEVIFTCGGAICDSVVAASKKVTGKTAKMIGVDVNQHPQQENDLYITSAEKKVEKTTKEAMLSYFNQFAKDAKAEDFTGTWPTAQAGKHSILGSTTNSVGLPTDKIDNDDPWTFTTFTKDAYNELYAKLQGNEKYTKVVSDNDSNTTFSEAIDNTNVKITLTNIGSEVKNRPVVKVSENLITK